MRILLTGSGGFIGKNLKKILSPRYDLLTPRSTELDLTCENAVKEYFNHNTINFIIHCGSIGGTRGIEDDKDTINKNLSMLNNLIKYKPDNVRIITFGSGAMYGKDRPIHKIKEDEIGNYIPKDLYGISKLEMSKIVKARNDILMLNIFACYGYDELESRFPSYAINCVLENKPVIINQNVIFDYLWVEDMEKIVEYFIKHKPNDKIINITPSKSVSLTEISEIVKTFTNNNLKIIIQKDGLNNEYTGDNSLLIKNYTDIKFETIEQGLKKLFDYKRKTYVHKFN